MELKWFQSDYCFFWFFLFERVVDTIGISDTQLSEEQILDELLKAIHTAKNGISQIFLVINSKLTKEEIATYKLLKDVLFDQSVTNHITIVRTNFSDFQDKQKCAEDREKIKKESKQLSDIANFSPIIYVNNPSNDSQTRADSREVLLEHLTNNSDVYKTMQLDELINQIGNYINKTEKSAIIETKLKKAQGKLNNKKEIKQLEKELEKVRKEKTIAFQEIMKEIEKKKEWKEWKEWSKKHGIEVLSLGANVAAVVIPLACRVM